MKTTHSFLKRTCLFLALFSWLLPMNLMADVTAEWNNSTGFPSNTTSTIGNVTLDATNLTAYSTIGPCYNMGNGHYVDVNLNSGWDITQISISVYNENSTTINIQFATTPTYSGTSTVGSSIAVTGQSWGDWNNNPTTLFSTSSVPSGAKSARIYCTGGEGWGGYLYRLVVTITEAAACAAPVTATFAASGAESSGAAPDNIEVCTDYASSFTIPGKNTLVYDTKHAFVGWEKGGVTYAEDATYTITSADISAGTIAFTAVWSEVKAYDLAITDPVNNTIPLSWKIPGICDIKHGGTPIFTPDNGSGYYGTLTNSTYNNEGDYITAEGITPQYGQYGIGFDIPATTELSWLSYEWKGSYGNIWLCGAVCDNSHAYWQLGSERALDNYSEFTERGKLYPNQIFWDKGAMPAGAKVSQVVIYANAGGYADDVSFSVRNVRYGISGRADIDHIVLVRKAESIPANASDGDVIYTGSSSHFTDTDVKTPGTTYYYAVFAVFTDASVSSPVYVSHTMETVDTYTVTYEKGEGTVTGDVPTDAAEYAQNNSVTIAGKNNLARAGYTFAGWNDGSTTYNPGDSYTMPDHNVTFTAQWTPFVLPTVTNLTLDGVDKTVTLSWNIPGICDLSNPIAANKSADPVNLSSASYDAEGDFVTASGTSIMWEQYGVAFAIPATTNLEWLSFDYKGYHDDISLWGGACDNSYAYWSGNTSSLDDNANWQSSGAQTPVWRFWHESMGGEITSKTISQVAIYANAGNATYDDVSFSVRNVRYHVSGREDIDHIVLVRKDGSAPANPTDGDVLPAGNRSAFVDDDASKVDGHTYYYKVFSVHADGTYAAPEAVSYTIPAAPSLTYYERTVTPGEYGTVCIGYAVEHANISGATMYEIDSWSADGKALTLSELGDSESMVAGRPYIFYANASTLSLGYDGSASEASAGDHNGLIGSYSQEEITANADNYIIYQNKLWLVDVLAYVGEHRAYIHKTNASPAPGRRQIKLYVAGTEVATGLEQINGTCPDGKFIQDGQLFIRRDGRTYNAQGAMMK